MSKPDGKGPQSQETKIEILNLASKLLVLSRASEVSHLAQPLTLLFEYTIALARYDLEYPVRDRARFLRGLITGAGLMASEAASQIDMQSFASGEQVEAPEQTTFFTIPQVKVLLFEASENQTEDLQTSAESSP